MVIGTLKLKSETVDKWLDLSGWTRQRLAEALSVTPEFVSMLMNNKRKPSMATLEDLCRLTGLEPGVLLSFDRDEVADTKES